MSDLPATPATPVAPASDEAAPQSSSPQSSPRAWSPAHGQIALAPAALAAQGALGPWLGGAVRLAVALPGRFFLALGGFASPQRAHVSGVLEGSASVSAFAVRLGLGRILLSTSRVRLDGALGTGLLGLTASGAATADLVSTTDFTAGLWAHGELGLDVRLAGRFSLRADLVGGWLYRRPVLIFDAREVTAVGRGVLMAAVGLQASF